MMCGSTTSFVGILFFSCHTLMLTNSDMDSMADSKGN